MGGGLSKHEDEAGSPRVVSLEQVTKTSSNTTQEQSGMQENESKCPMHNKDGSYRYDWTQLFRAAAVHGPKGSKPLSKEQQEGAKKSSFPSSEGGCPVKHNNSNLQGEQGGGCPVKAKDSSSAYPEYNVYSQPIDTTNQMPKGVRTQLPNSYQQKELSTHRVSSTIAKGGGDGDQASTWTYPSPQQFYNSLARKGKLGDDASEEDMDTVVALHNNMNEKTWAKVVEWEKQTHGKHSVPKLLKFQGRPHDLSPKATLKHYVLGHPLPYDRHDWTVLRDDGTTVRYVIDYYYDETRAQETPESAKPELHDRDATPSLLVDVRPALDGPSQFLSRAFQMPYKIMSSQTTFEPLPMKGTPEMTNQVKESVQVWQSIQQLRKQELADEDEAPTMESMKISEEQAKDIAISFSNVLKKCKVQQKKLDACDSENECAKASMDLTMCMGPVLCPVQHKSLLKTLEADDDDKIEASLETLSECVLVQTAERKLAENKYPNLFKK